MLMYLILNGSDKLTIIVQRLHRALCNGRPMLWRGLEVVGFIKVIIIIIIIIIIPYSVSPL